MGDTCSAQVQAQNKHSRGRKTKGSALNLPAAFADINIHKGRSVCHVRPSSAQMIYFDKDECSLLCRSRNRSASYFKHGVDEEEVIDVLSNPGEDRPGREGSRVAIGKTRAGRYLRVIYVPDPEPESVSCAESHCSPIEDAYVRKEGDETE